MTTMGIIFANIYDSSLGELTNKRTMASLPYGGRYRQIDFSLSNMTNSAIRHIGIITKYNYQSLMNHIGSGQEWDLELGEGGLEFLTPFAMGHNGSYRGKLEALDSAMNFLKISTEEYVVLADSGVLCAINLEKIVEAHAASGADVTVVVKDLEILGENAHGVVMLRRNAVKRGGHADGIRRVLEALLGKIRRKIRSELEHGLVPLGISNLLLG